MMDILRIGARDGSVLRLQGDTIFRAYSVQNSMPDTNRTESRYTKISRCAVGVCRRAAAA
jgi:hypothetical protein